MENSSENNKKRFNIEESPVSEAYKLLGATTPLELSNLYAEADQPYFRSGLWDYNNAEQVTNKVKVILEKVDFHTLPEEESEWVQEILWFWYHHAISVALWHNDKLAAQRYSTKAVELLSKDHPNKITRLLFYLVHDKLGDAEVWVSALRDDVKGDDKESARDLLNEYKEKNGLFAKQF